MRPLTVTGLSEDGLRLELRAGEEVFELPLEEVRRAQRRALARDDGSVPTPREIQARIRAGESAADLARDCGLPIEVVARYEGPVLAERAHQAQSAGKARVDGRVVRELVDEHLEKAGQADAEWDAWRREDGRWDVVAGSGPQAVRLVWDAVNRKVLPADDVAREALLLAPRQEDALGAVLRPVSRRREPARAEVPPPTLEVSPEPEPEPDPGPVAAPPEPVAVRAAVRPAAEKPAAEKPATEKPAAPAPRKPRASRAQVPLWSDIVSEVAGRGADAEERS